MCSCTSQKDLRKHGRTRSDPRTLNMAKRSILLRRVRGEHVHEKDVLREERVETKQGHKKNNAHAP